MSSRHAQVSLFLLRLSLGWLFFYAGITKVLDPEWSAAGYLNNAASFPGFYAWLASPGLLPFTDFLNQWGLTLIGLTLIFGVFTKLSSRLGFAMMILYWLPALDFPKVGHGFIVDEHVIYAFALCYLCAVGAGRTTGLDAKLVSLPFFKSHPKLTEFLL